MTEALKLTEEELDVAAERAPILIYGNYLYPGLFIITEKIEGIRKRINDGDNCPEWEEYYEEELKIWRKRYADCVSYIKDYNEQNNNQRLRHQR